MQRAPSHIDIHDWLHHCRRVMEIRRIVAHRTMLWTGLIGAWLALTGILAAPLAGPMRMAASVAIGAPICGEHAGQPVGGDPSGGERRKMGDCALCCCCAPVLATLASPPVTPRPARVVLAAFAPVPPGRAPPPTILASAYPRGPPASI